MARTPAPPGPPPPHYRPPGTEPAPPVLPPLGDRGAPGPEPAGIGPGGATAVALLTLLVGVVIGFVLGRAFEDGGPEAAPPLTSPSTSTSRPPGDTIPQAPPTPGPTTSTPPGTELAPATIGTFEDPIPAGQAYILGLYEIEVLGVTLDAADELAAFSSDNPPPDPGDQHVLVELRIRFTDRNGPGSAAEISFFVSDGTSEWYDFGNRCGIVPDDLGRTGFLGFDEEVVGQRCFTVPADAVDALVLGTEGFAGPVYFALPG